ncbi:MAG: glycosyltransferase family 4 protein [Aestuariivirga sp.]
MKIIHVFRTPMGGLFRHVCDLAREQRRLGHDVGVICDSNTGVGAERELSALAIECNLGLTRIPIGTLPGFGDLKAARMVTERARQTGADIIHGHGAKGGVYARLAARRLGVAGVYSPHGGSLHFNWLKPPGAAFLMAERMMRFRKTGIIFVCQFEKALFERKVGLGTCQSTVVYNGLRPQEFTSRVLAPDATDFLFVGEMRKLKGVDVLLQALAQIRKTRPFTLTLVGDGRDLIAFQKSATELGLSESARFVGRKSMAEALPLGKILVLPSRHESFPYVVLEAVAAKVPLIASNVGGIAEILPQSLLVPAGDAQALAQAMSSAAERGDATALATSLQAKAAQEFTVRIMAERICAFYGTVR